MQFDFLRVPLLLQGAVMVEDLVDDGEDVAGAFAVIGGRISAGPGLVIVRRRVPL